jgi:hypothetical protein
MVIPARFWLVCQRGQTPAVQQRPQLFDQTKPVEGTEIDAAELRNQFNALKALCDTQQTQITALQAQNDA